MYIRFGNPGRSKPHTDLGSTQIFGLHLLKCFYVSGKFGIGFGLFPCLFQFIADVTGKVFIGHEIRFCADHVPVFGVTEDNTFKIHKEFFFVLPCQFAHIFHIHHSPLTHRECKSFACRVYTVYRDLRLDGSLGEHVRFCLQLLVFVKDFKRTQEEI